MLCSLDTKAGEAQFLRNCIEEQGAKTVLIDVGYGQPAKMAATINARDVAIAAGGDIDDIREMQDTGAAAQLMMQGAIIKVQALFLNAVAVVSAVWLPPAVEESSRRKVVASLL